MNSCCIAFDGGNDKAAEPTYTTTSAGVECGIHDLSIFQGRGSLKGYELFHGSTRGILKYK